MARMKDPYLAGWNAAIEAAALKVRQYEDWWLKMPDELVASSFFACAEDVEELRKPDPIDDQWRRANDGDCGVSHD